MTNQIDFTIEDCLRLAGFRSEPRRNPSLATSGMRAGVRIEGDEFMGDFYAEDAFERFGFKEGAA